MSPLRLSPSIALLRTQSDDRLVALARDGWEPAFTALVERYRREVLRGCRRVLPEARAEDACQQVFMAAWRALRRGDEVRDVRPWLLRIARNTALNALRVPGYDHGELEEFLRAGEAPQAELERREVVRQTLAGLAALPERQRDALLRSAVEGASHAEIAAALGIKEGAARQLVLRARMTLRGAATALTPAPLLTWALARAGDASLADAVAGGSAAGAGGLVAKAGVIAVVAGGAVAAPVAVHHHRAAGPEAAEAATVTPSPTPDRHRHHRHRQRARTVRIAATAPATPTAVPTATADDGGVHQHRGRGSDDGPSDDHGGRTGSGRSGTDDATPEATAVPTPASTPTSGSDDGGSSGPGGGDDGSSGPGPSGTSGSSGSSGSGDGGMSTDDHISGSDD